jgi:hypothetical protein
MIDQPVKYASPATRTARWLRVEFQLGVWTVSFKIDGESVRRRTASWPSRRRSDIDLLVLAVLTLRTRA